jgi:exopolysaccharide biosynthesis polyprenyl glycosylphosphotransferase
MRAVTNWSPTVQTHTFEAYRRVKRGVDVIVALVLLICLAPVLLACALAIVIDSPGPVLFRQERVGAHGKRFAMLKFRSMEVAADAAVHREYAVAYVRGTAQSHVSAGEALFKLADDPRVTTVGRFMRRTSLDELPQLWNVLRGDMSLVGPRPPMPYEVEHYQPHHFERLSVRPGITGAWQVGGRCRTTFEVMVAMDCDYIRQQSLMLDLKILLQTVPVVFLGKGGR